MDDTPKILCPVCGLEMKKVVTSMKKKNYYQCGKCNGKWVKDRYSDQLWRHIGG